MTFYDHLVTFDRCLDAHLGEHVHDGFRPVAFLVGKTSYACKPACSLTEGSQDRDDREEVRAVGGIHTEGRQRGSLNSYAASIAVKLGEAGTCIHEDVHDGKVCLQRGSVKSVEDDLSEDCSCNKEGSCSAPVAFEVNVGSLVALASLDLEDHLRAERPVTA